MFDSYIKRPEDLEHVLYGDFVTQYNMNYQKKITSYANYK